MITVASALEQLEKKAQEILASNPEFLQLAERLSRETNNNLRINPVGIITGNFHWSGVPGPQGAPQYEGDI